MTMTVIEFGKAIKLLLIINKIIYLYLYNEYFGNRRYYARY